MKIKEREALEMKLACVWGRRVDGISFDKHWGLLVGWSHSTFGGIFLWLYSLVRPHKRSAFNN